MRIKEKLEEYIPIVIVIIGILCVLIGTQTTPTNWTLLSIGSALLLSLYIYFKYSSQKVMEDIESSYQKRLQKLKATADRVIVILDKAIIQEKNHYNKHIVVSGKAAALNEIAGYGQHNEETVQHTSCEVTFKAIHHQKEITLKTIIHKGETNVRMHFYLQKETVAYINPYDPEEYYIDLEFMENT